MSLKESARQWVLTNLPYDRGDAALAAYLTGLDAHDLLVVFHNWMSRLVKPQPRVVYQSAAYRSNPLTAQRASDLALLVADIEQGCDLKKYLSRDIARAPAGVPGDRRPDLDPMLNDWGVHHLHISSVVDVDGFVRRDGPLLFVVFKPDAAYFIDIMSHLDWTRDHVLEVLASEWPTSGVIHEVKGVERLAWPVTEDDRRILRKNQINAWFEFGGKVFAPAGGVSAAGTTVAATRATDRLLDWLEGIEAHPDRVKADFAAHGVQFPDEPEFVFVIDEHGPGVFERKTGTMIPMAG